MFSTLRYCAFFGNFNDLGTYIKQDLDDEEEGVTLDNGVTEIIKGTDQFYCIGKNSTSVYRSTFS